MYIANAYYKAIPVTGATFPLAAGTIVTANGTVPASADQYFGIVPEKVEKMPTTGYIFVAVSGTIDLDTCGVTFTDAQIKALGADFNFVRAKEEHEPPAPELPAVDSGDNGKVLTVVSGEWAAANSPLPAVTGTDNGKILKVVSGEWAAANASSGGALLVDIEYGESKTLNKTYAEISAALAAGVTPVVREVDPQYEGATTYWTIIGTDTREGYTVNVYNKGLNNTSTFGSQTENGTLTYME